MTYLDSIRETEPQDHITMHILIFIIMFYIYYICRFLNVHFYKPILVVDLNITQSIYNFSQSTGV